MKTIASIAFLAALVAPIFAVPFEQLEARKYDDDNSSTSIVFRTKTSFIAQPTTQVPYIRAFESLTPSQLTIAPSATTTHRGPHHTSASEDDEHEHHTRSGSPFHSGSGVPHHTSASEDDEHEHHTRSGSPFHSGSGVPHHTHHTRSSFTVHPTGKPYHATY